MCGIAGIVRITPPDGDASARAMRISRPHAEAIPEKWLDILDASIRHRGPDGQGRFRDRAVRADGAIVDVAFVHRRLSIVDHADGAQPMVSLRGPTRSSSGGPTVREGSAASSSETALLPPPLLFQGKPNANVEYRALPPSPDLVAVVFNGCIYNHRDLRAELQAAGHEFVTDHADTEVLLHGWRERGTNAFGALNGMFATVTWDAAAGTTALARDPLGEKPLYMFHVSRDRSWFNVFVSTPPEVTRLAAAIGAPDRDVPAGIELSAWLRFGYGRANPIRGARAVEPGCVVSYQRATGTLSQGSDPGSDDLALAPSVTYFGPFSRNGQCSRPHRGKSLTPTDADRLLSQAVARRLEADVPLGCFLSGGVDSSLVAHYAKVHAGEVRTFTVRMPTPDYDESAHAETAARHIGAKHETLDCDARPAEDLVRLIQQVGVPLGDSSLLPTYWVSRAARRHVKVALSGDGGDELFVGYDRYHAIHLMLPRLPMAATLAGVLARGAPPTSKWSRAARYFDAVAHAGYWDLVSIFPSSLLHGMLTDQAMIQHDLDWTSKWPKRWRIDTAVILDLCNYLPDDILRKTDSASMSVALEVRAPFLDPELVRACISADFDSLLHDGTRKGLLRAVARRHLPAEIVDRPKMGFAIPIGEWFRSDYGSMKTLLMDHMNSVEPFGPPALGIELNMAFARQMIDEHMSQKRDHSQRLYMLLVLSIWAKWLGGLRTEA